MMISLFLFNFFFSLKSFDEQSCLIIKMSEPILRGKDSIELVFSVKNCSKGNLILYNLAEAIEADEFEESNYCNPNITAGITLFIYDANSEMMLPDITYADSIAVHPHLEDWFLKSVKEARSKFHKNMMLANAGHSIELRRTVGLKRFHLKKGTYSLMLIYFTGENISNLVDSNQMEADQRKHHAKIYQGCVRSNKVTLVVE